MRLLRIPIVLMLFALLGAALPVARPARLAWELLPARDAAGRTLGTLVVPSILSTTQSRATQPTIVVFNGGPGASSGWLQLGLLGPLQVDLPDDPAIAMPRDASLRPATHRIDRIADIVFMDPLDTGFSRRAPGVDPQRVRNLDADGDYLARAVSLWLARHGRADSPVILVGESYGAERAVAVADAWRRNDAGVKLAGLVLISQTVLNEFALGQEDRLLALATGLPTMAATACYHGLAHGASHDPQACAERAIAVGEGPYLSLLREGGSASSQARGHLATQLAETIGLDQTLPNEAVLSMSRNAYRMKALGAQGLALGMYDSRRAAVTEAAQPWRDPSLEPVLHSLTRAAERYNHELLGLERSPVDGSPYVLYDPLVRASWRQEPGGAYHLADRLAALLRQSGARLLVAGGLFDSVGSVGVDRVLVARLGLSEDQAQVLRYPGGHMFYLDGGNRADFLRRLEDFVRPAIGHAALPHCPASFTLSMKLSAMIAHGAQGRTLG